MKYFELQILYERCYTNKVFLTNNSEFFGAKRKEGSSPILHGEKKKCPLGRLICCSTNQTQRDFCTKQMCPPLMRNHILDSSDIILLYTLSNLLISLPRL